MVPQVCERAVTLIILTAGVAHHPAHPHPPAVSRDAYLTLPCCQGRAPSCSPSSSTGVAHYPHTFPPSAVLHPWTLTHPSLLPRVPARCHPLRNPLPVWSLSLARVVHHFDREGKPAGVRRVRKREVGGGGTSFCMSRCRVGEMGCIPVVDVDGMQTSETRRKPKPDTSHETWYICTCRLLDMYF